MRIEGVSFRFPQAEAANSMFQNDIQTELLIALSILVWMIGLFLFDTIRRHRQEKREAWKKESERRWN